MVIPDDDGVVTVSSDDSYDSLSDIFGSRLGHVTVTNSDDEVLILGGSDDSSGGSNDSLGRTSASQHDTAAAESVGDVGSGPDDEISGDVDPAVYSSSSDDEQVYIYLLSSNRIV